MTKKQKVGLLTMPIKENYGGIIQIAALYQFLEAKGYEPHLIMKKYDESRAKRILRYILSHNPAYRIFDYKNLTKREKQATKLKKFISDFFQNKTISLFNRGQFIKSTEGFDAIIVGSDQVWRYKYVGKNFRYYFLDFITKPTKKISYAASFGIDNWEGPNDTVPLISRLLADFQAISVREDSGVVICKETFGVDDTRHVLDPTFLPEIEFYDNIIDVEGISKTIQLFSYVLDKGKHINQTLEYLSEVLRLSVSTIELTEYKNNLNPSIGEWLYNFREADFVVTDSFHGVVFCLLFKKQFVCIGNKVRGYTRFESLLKMFGMLDRLIFDFNQAEISRLISNPIDYNGLEPIKQKYKSQSEHFLISNLQDE